MDWEFYKFCDSFFVRKLEFLKFGLPLLDYEKKIPKKFLQEKFLFSRFLPLSEKFLNFFSTRKNMPKERRNK